MIIYLRKKYNELVYQTLIERYEGIRLKSGENQIVVTPSKFKELDASFDEIIERITVFDSDMQLSSKKFQNDKREIKIGDIIIGGNSRHCAVITGPCSVESREQMSEVSEMLEDLGLKFLRGGCFKPRTSPYSFQGLGKEGLEILSEIRAKYGYKIITEVRDYSHVNDIIEHSDIIQVGAKAMYDHGILRACSKTNKPILLKRGFGSTLQEFVQAAEFILSGGNENVILCERGIRTFETKTRFTLDLCGVAYLKEYTNLPIFLDPSHAMGYSYGVPDLTRACLAMDVDGLLIESHPCPSKAKSDASQQLTLNEFRDLWISLKKISEAIGKELI